MAVSLPLFCSSELRTSAFCLMCLPTHLQIEFACGAGRHASDYSCVGRKRERNVRRDGYRRHLGDLHCPLANNMAAQYPAGRAVDDQLAKTYFAPVNDCACSRVEAYNRDPVDHVWLSRHERDLFRFNGHHPMSRGIEAP